MDYCQVLPNLFLGSYPASTEDLESLRVNHGVDALLNLQTDSDLLLLQVPMTQLQDHCRTAGVELVRVPVPDLNSLELQLRLGDCVQALSTLLDGGRTVYVHCTAGAWRSPTTVIGYLYSVLDWELEEAIRHVTKLRACYPSADIIKFGCQKTLRTE